MVRSDVRVSRVGVRVYGSSVWDHVVSVIQCNSIAVHIVAEGRRSRMQAAIPYSMHDESGTFSVDVELRISVIAVRATRASAWKAEWPVSGKGCGLISVGSRKSCKNATRDRRVGPMVRASQVLRVGSTRAVNARTEQNPRPGVASASDSRHLMAIVICVCEDAY